MIRRLSGDRLALCYGLAAVLLWSTVATAFKLALRELDVLQLLAYASLGLPGWRGLAGAAYVGLFEMGLTFALWSTALSLSSGVSRIGNLIFLSPLISMVFIATVLGEVIHPATLAGLALIIPGVLLQQKQQGVV